jgi:6-phosphogluconolactonase
LVGALLVAAACEGSDDDGAPGGGSDAGSAEGGKAAGGSSSGGSGGSSRGGSAGSANGGGAGSSSSGDAGKASGGTGASGGAAMAGAGEGGEPSQPEGGMSAGGGAGGEGGQDSEPPIGGRQFVYVSRILGGVFGCSIDSESGVPTPLPGNPVRPNGFAASIAVAPSQKFLFVADEDAHIYTFPIAADGTLSAQPSSSVELDAAPIGLTIEPQGRFAYVASRNGSSLTSLEIDEQTGALSAVGEPLLVGPGPDHAAPVYIAAAPGGHFVYVSMSSEQGIRGYAIDAISGELEEIAGSPFASAGLPDGDIVFGGAIAFKPSGDFAYTVGGALNAFALDPETGKLTLVEGSPFTKDVQSDANAPNVTIDAQGKYLYATRFLLTNHVSGFAIDAASGKLKEVPGSPVTDSAPYSLALGPGGRFLYIGNDLPQMNVYSVARGSGRLTLLPGAPFMFGGLEVKLAFAVLP